LFLSSTLGGGGSMDHDYEALKIRCRELIIVLLALLVLAWWVKSL